MEQVKNLDDKRVCNQNKDGKVKERLYYSNHCQCRQNTQDYA